MANTYCKLYMHIIWHVKTMSPRIRPEDKNDLYAFIGSTLKDNGCTPIIINGTDNHVHAVFILSKLKTVDEIVGAMKRTSSLWMKHFKPYYNLFYWQSGYAAYTVSYSVLERLKEYVVNQEEHHKRETFEEEYRRFLNATKTEYDERYLFCD